MRLTPRLPASPASSATPSIRLLLVPPTRSRPCCTPTSSFAALVTSFHLLTSGPAPLALDGRRLGHGLPARPIPLDELAALLLHPSVPAASQRVVLDALVHRATTLRGGWLVGLAGVLLPGLRRTAALAAPLADQLAVAVEADLLARFQDTLGRPHPHPAGLRLATGLLGA